MKYTFIHDEKTYTVDDSKRYDKQTKSFRQLWETISVRTDASYTYFDFENISVIVYDLGGIIVTERESEVDDE